MSLLTQFGVTPIKKISAKTHIGKPYLTVSVFEKNKVYTFGLGSFISDEKLDWPGIDIAFSKQHGGIMIAKGDTFLFQKKADRPGRIDSKDIYSLIFKSFCLKLPKNKARVFFNYEFYSDDVYILKLENIVYE